MQRIARTLVDEPESVWRYIRGLPGIRSWKILNDMVFLILSGLLGTLWFVVAIVGFTVGVSLLIVIVGVPILAATIAILVWGANLERARVCAFLNIDLEAVGNWAEKRNLPYGGYAELSQKPEVAELIRDCVDKANADLAADEKLAGSQISRFLILHKELDADDGELTRTRKVRRGFIGDRYGVLVDALYGGKSEQYVETEVRFEDGRTGRVTATLKIIDVPTYPSVGRAA